MNTLIIIMTKKYILYIYIYKIHNEIIIIFGVEAHEISFFQYFFIKYNLKYENLDRNLDRKIAIAILLIRRSPRTVSSKF